MDTLACIKRVPDTGATINLTDDAQHIDTSNLGFRIAPHEECAIEAAVQAAETYDGSSTVLSLGPEEATEQLRTGLAMNADQAQLLTVEEEWRSRSTARAIADATSNDAGEPLYDLLLFGSESADLGSYQVGVRVAEQLDVPFVAGASDLDIEQDQVTIRRDISGGEEIYELSLPAAVSVNEGFNEPRYPSMRDRMRARNQNVVMKSPTRPDTHGRLEKIRLEAPQTNDTQAKILGEGTEAVPAVLDVLENDLEVI